MTGSWMCIGTALLIAAAMAFIAFSLAQVGEGLGVMFVVLASGCWVAYSAARQRRRERDGAMGVSGSSAQKLR
ncbi:hypothetical protein [Sphingomonas sp. LaA6.9]|uniref:hypothetical protein n=1 Tax=Sphingomonas sp. LaA6.9 TaxID=2919914 RepID=UPI001F4FD5A4|nr:hypothetical protein [Sphingomonas sp. LaA6.9]MCJ8159047.1 hypothetical protein [Sphingomonas sp. LaA6.9]